MARIRNTIADIAELLRRGITEPINALLHITDHGKFGCISADFANESILQGVIILAFIHINISPLSTDTLGHVRLLHGIQCPESHITELRYGLLLFHKRILLVERGDERNQSFESSRSDLIKRVHLFSGKGQFRLQIRNDPFNAPHRFRQATAQFTVFGYGDCRTLKNGSFADSNALGQYVQWIGIDNTSTNCIP